MVAWVNRWIVLTSGFLLILICPQVMDYVHPFTTVVETIYYSSFFIFGCVLARYQEDVKIFLGKLQVWKKAALVLAGFGFYNWGWEFWNARSMDSDLTSPNIFLSGIAPGVGSCLIISSALTFEKIQRILNHKILLWTGKVSYSLYLTHMVVLPAAIYFLPTSIPLLGRVILGVCLSFLVAGLSYQFLELPCISIGHSLAKKLEARRSMASVKV